ncbi:MAG: MFS transporter, partial [Acidimicrobiales bacterium]
MSRGGVRMRAPAGGGTPAPVAPGDGGRSSRRLAVICAVLFLTFLDNTIISATLASIQTTLSPGVAGLQWVIDGFMLTFAVLMLTGGTLGDLFGRKRIMLGGVALFCVGSSVALLAPDTNVLIAGRVVMGIGAAASEPGTLSMIRHVYPDRGPRARALGAWAAVSGAALAFGPIIGGAIVGLSTWREVFAFNVAFGLAVLVFGAKVLPENADPGGRRVDIWGLALGTCALAAATVAVIQGESAGYGTWWIDTLFGAAVVATGCFVVVERRVHDPVLKVEFFKDRTFTGANVVAFTTNFGVFAVFFFTILYLQLIAGFSGYRIALDFLAMAVGILVAAGCTGWWVSRWGPRWPTAAGCLLAGGGLIAVEQVLSPTVTAAELAWTLAVVGLGFGMTLVTMTAAVLSRVPAERSGMAASTVNTSREIGGLFSVAILGAIVNGQISSRLASRLHHLGIPSNFESLVIKAVLHGGVSSTATGAAKAHPHLVHEVIAAAEHAFGSGLDIALLIAAAL